MRESECFHSGGGGGGYNILAPHLTLINNQYKRKKKIISLIFYLLGITSPSREGVHPRQLNGK